jgi:hypothetical protein
MLAKIEGNAVQRALQFIDADDTGGEGTAPALVL